MTMPHLMNCAHASSGWCLDCVKELHQEKEKLEQELHKERDRIPDHIIRCPSCHRMGNLQLEQDFKLKRNEDTTLWKHPVTGQWALVCTECGWELPLQHEDSA